MSRASGMDLCGLSVFENFKRGQTSGCAHNAAAGMRRRSAHVEIFYGRAELRPARDGAQEKQLFERQFALEDVAFAQSPFTLQIERGDDLAMQDDVFNI